MRPTVAFRIHPPHDTAIEKNNNTPFIPRIYHHTNHTADAVRLSNGITQCGFDRTVAQT